MHAEGSERYSKGGGKDDREFLRRSNSVLPDLRQ